MDARGNKRHVAPRTWPVRSVCSYVYVCEREGEGQNKHGREDGRGKK